MQLLRVWNLRWGTLLLLLFHKQYSLLGLWSMNLGLSSFTHQDIIEWTQNDKRIKATDSSFFVKPFKIKLFSYDEIPLNGCFDWWIISKISWSSKLNNLWWEKTSRQTYHKVLGNSKFESWRLAWRWSTLNNFTLKWALIRWLYNWFQTLKTRIKKHHY